MCFTLRDAPDKHRGVFREWSLKISSFMVSPNADLQKHSMLAKTDFAEWDKRHVFSYQQRWIKTFHIRFQSPVWLDQLTLFLKGIVHFEINVCYVLSYLKGIQDVGVSAVVSILIFLVFQSYNGGLWSPPQKACTEKSRLNMI